MHKKLRLFIFVAVLGGGIIGFSQWRSSMHRDSEIMSPAEIQKQLEASSKKQASLQNALETADRNLKSLTTRQKQQITRVARARREYDATRAAWETSKQRLTDLHEAVKDRLVALYKFKQIGYAAPLIAARDLRGILEGSSLMAKMAMADDRLFAAFHRQSLNLEATTADLEQETTPLQQLQQQLSSTEARLAAVREEQSGLQARLKQEKQRYAAFLKKLEQPPRPAQPRMPAVNRGQDPPASAFSRRQGSLPLPTPGSIIETYGSKRRLSSGRFLYNNGVVIKAPMGQSIQAIHDGKVIFADWFKEYGKMMIIDHGNHYYSLLAHLDQCLKSVGDEVKAGEMIATVGNSGAQKDPKLYFEIRHHGKALDPMEWLAVQKFSKQ